MKKTLFYHGKTCDGNMFTIAGKYSGIGNPEKRGINTIEFGISLCSKSDQFNKKLGRNKAGGRMNATSRKGCHHISLYEKMKTENYFKGQEIDIFLKECAIFSNMTSNRLKHIFNLK